MKKALSIILCLVMVISLVAVYVSAAPKADSVGKVAAGYKPEGTGIDSLEKITDPAGKYYLTSDITVSATHTAEFKGTLDGNGHTITTSVALFEKVTDATIKNFVVKGNEIKLTEAGVAIGDNDFYAVVAIIANGKSTFKNIRNQVSVSTTFADTKIAAIVGTSEKGFDLTIDTCVNEGNISVVKYAAGVYGWSAKAGSAVITNCANYGNITATEGYAGGVVSRLSGKNGSLKISDCANHGNVSAPGSYAAGVLAYTVCITEIENCTNYGKISSNGYAGGIIANYDEVKSDTAGAQVIHNCANHGDVESSSKSKHVGGIAGYIYKSSKAYPDVQNCVNYGKVKGGLYTSQILGYSNAVNAVIKNNLAVGSVSGAEYACFLAGSSANFTELKDVSGNFYIENDGTTFYTCKTKEYSGDLAGNPKDVELAKAPEGKVIVATKAQLASGEVAFKLNKAIGKDVFRQTVGKGYPSFTGKKVIQNEDGTYANPTSASTGDSTMVIAMAAVLTLGTGITAVVRKKVSAR